ncbi:peptide/nickel transport system ATP-binding protein [Actinacidiphila alni]|uniref:Peptide/nickel transport system ATP-binding protein n=1 Tax=Actinacidiphila alni TaxID=380248 RepID=A0A1I2HM51_9ACTN|nr:peptide/nickel transport system ATP-binding protein [Actinacidiphila alni]
MTATANDTYKAPDTAPPILEAVGLTRHIPMHGRRHGQVVRAVDGVDLALRRGQILALVGQSGSGKSTLARLLALGDRPTSGEIRFDGRPVNAERRRDRRRHYGHVQMIMQDPFASLNRLHRLRYILSRPLRNFGTPGAAELEARIIELLERVNLTPGREFIDKYPHELSGGQRQRAAVARALAADPSVLLGDEPVSMLDVSIRLDILNLLTELRDRDGLSMLYITHDIASARHVADEVVVMFSGHLVEGGPAEAVTQNAKHPYTQLLLAASPDPDRLLSGEAGTGTAAASLAAAAGGPDADDDPDSAAGSATGADGGTEAGCPFRARCPHAQAICAERMPEAADAGSGHWVRCWLHT